MSNSEQKAISVCRYFNAAVLILFSVFFFLIPEAIVIHDLSDPGSIVGVQRMVLRRAGKMWIFWKATWCPEPYVVARKVFSARKYGTRKAKLLAIRARRAGLRSMQ
jgi:hypothetical protein